MSLGGVLPVFGESARKGQHQTLVGRLGKWERFTFGVHFDSLAGGFDDDAAVVALGQVLLQFMNQAGVQLAIQILGKLSDGSFAGHLNRTG